MPKKDPQEEGRGFRVIDRRGEARSEEESAPPQAPPEAPSTDEPAQEPGAESVAGEDAFAHFIMSLATSAYMHLGLIVPPGEEKIERNLTLAQQSIDILGMISEKTRGNLNAKEEALLQQVLSELRLHFVNEQRRGAPTK